MKLRLGVTLALLTACSSEAAPEVTVTADTSVPVTTTAEPKIAPVAPRKPARFVMVGPTTTLKVSPSRDAADIEVTEPAMILTVAPEQPDHSGWVRLVETHLKSRCGYANLKTDAPVYAERSSLLRTLTEDFVYEVSGKTRAHVILRAGVALLPRDKDTPKGTDYEVAIRTAKGGNRVRATLPLDEAALPRVINGAQLTAPLASSPAPMASASSASAPSSAAPPALPSPSPAQIEVGGYVVRLPKEDRPSVSRFRDPTSAADRVTLKTGCLEVVGTAPSAGLLGLLSVPTGSLTGSPFSPSVKGLTGNSLSARGLSGVEPVEMRGPGLHGLNRGGGSTGEGLVGTGTLGTKGRTGRGYGTGHGRGKTTSRVRIGSALVRGGVDAAVVRRLVSGKRARFDACYAVGLTRTAALEGRVLIELKVDPAGKVTSARAIPKSQAEPSGTDLSDASVVSCVTRTLLGVTFMGADEASVVRLPLIFSP